MTGISAFNRNILYCKFQKYGKQAERQNHLIGTFCIVNTIELFTVPILKVYLIGTFCIVNLKKILKDFPSEIDLIGTFCIVNAFRSSKQALNEKS